MTYIVTSEYELSQVAPPNLPLAPTGYDSRYQDQLNNVLRLYFNQLNKIIDQLRVDVTADGSLIQFPNGAFHQDGTTTLTAAITNTSTTPIPVVSTAAFPTSGYLLIDNELIQYTGTTSTTFTGITRGVLGSTTSAHSSGAYATECQGTGSGTTIGVLKLNNTDYSNNVSINSSDITQIKFTKAGLYNIQFSAQLLSYANAADNVTIWIRQNGTDVASTAGIQSVPAIHGGVAGAIIASWNYFLQVNANDYIQRSEEHTSELQSH